LSITPFVFFSTLENNLKIQIMTKVLNFLLLAVLISGCSTGNHADFEANTVQAKEYFLLHQNENAFYKGSFCLFIII
tara:strand:- start:1532 stop:1762 length:231 start_codon:yes stop_codon:yes gene_type:complete